MQANESNASEEALFCVEEGEDGPVFEVIMLEGEFVPPLEEGFWFFDPSNYYYFGSYYFLYDRNETVNCSLNATHADCSEPRWQLSPEAVRVIAYVSLGLLLGSRRARGRS